MSKRKLNEDDESGVENSASAAAKKHSLDSDEEDEEGDSKKYEIMDEDDIEGQEEATIEFDGDIRITPFNMKEELEEGHFDKDGNYFLKKEQEVRDVWLDNIDWVKIKAKENPANTNDDEDDDSDSSDDTNAVKVDHMETFKKIVAYMTPGETILQAIKRLGQKSVSQSNASSRWKTKNRRRRTECPSNSEEVAVETDDDGGDTKKMLELTELADGLVHRGWMEIYQETYEKLNHRIRVRQDAGKKGSWAASGDNDDDALDMFADDFDDKNKAAATKPIVSQNGSSNTNLTNDPQPSTATGSTNLDSESANAAGKILWQFKWENADEAEIYGPHTSQEMSQWIDDGYFKEGVWVRRADQPEAQFYTSKRIDFDLYV